MRPALRSLPFVWGALGSVAVFAVLYLVFVRSRIGQQIDESAYTGADQWKGGLYELADAFLNALPAASVVIGCVAAVVIVLVRRNWTVFLVAVGVAAAANASTQILKYTILSRPAKGVDVGLSNSLPSGHTTVAASAALLVFLVTSSRFRPLAAVIGSSFTIVAGCSTLVEQWHRPSDVVAGMVVVAFWGCIGGLILAAMRARTVGAEPRLTLGPLLVVAVVAAAVAIASLAVTYFSAQSGAHHLFIAYAGGVAAIIGSGFLLAVLANRVFRALA